MSIPFKQIKNKLGLDDVLDFGKHQGLTVLECIQERNGYINWLIMQGKQFYPSVHIELRKYPFVIPRPKGDRGKKLYHYRDDYDSDLLGDWFDDIPF